MNNEWHDEWQSMTPVEQHRQMLRDIVLLHKATLELVEEHDWDTAYVLAVTGGWLNFIFDRCFSDADFHTFVDTMINTHKGRARNAS